MGILNSLQVYAGKWKQKKSEAFPQEDIALVSKVEVVPSQYGNSACFFMKIGGQVYIPMSNDATASVGDTIDLAKAELITLEKDGESDIVRLKA